MTETIHSHASELEALENHLAVYGPDLSRWPLATQQRFVVLLTNNGEAQRLMTEAKALHRVVFEGPIPAVQPEHASALRARLMRAVEVERGTVSLMGASLGLRLRDSIPVEVQDRPTKNLPRQAAAQPMLAQPRVFGLSAGAALAASLVLGLVAGTLGLADQILAPVSPIVSTQTDHNVEPDEASLDDELAFGSDVFDFDEEGTL